MDGCELFLMLQLMFCLCNMHAMFFKTPSNIFFRRFVLRSVKSMFLSFLYFEWLYQFILCFILRCFSMFLSFFVLCFRCLCQFYVLSVNFQVKLKLKCLSDSMFYDVCSMFWSWIRIQCFNLFCIQLFCQYFMLWNIQPLKSPASETFCSL